ncbi:MAG TPA: pantoate kinase [Methanoregulaceae archaeon]|nr:pantoate kinase [Methanoregulaceae archaeon]
MTSKVTAFCPGHISGYFKPVYGRDITETGSMGAGIVVDEGVTVTVTHAEKTRISIVRMDDSANRVELFCGSPPLKNVLDRLGVNADVTTRCRLPIGSGFGLSAAALMASVTAVNVLCDLGLSPSECSEYAHESEILFRTGLGDVAACQGGGRDCRKGPGIHAEITRHFDLAEPVYAVSFSSLPSPSILGSHEDMERILQAFPDGCPETPEEFFLFSRSFSDKSGLVTPQVRKALDVCDRNGIAASMTMLGNGIFAYGYNAEKILGQLGEPFELHAALSGVEIMEVQG